MDEIDEMVLEQVLPIEEKAEQFKQATKRKIADNKLIKKAFEIQLFYLTQRVRETDFAAENVIAPRYLDLSDNEFFIFKKEFCQVLCAKGITYETCQFYVYIYPSSFQEYIDRCKKRKMEANAVRQTTIAQAPYR